MKYCQEPNNISVFKSQDTFCSNVLRPTHAYGISFCILLSRTTVRWFVSLIIGLCCKILNCQIDKKDTVRIMEKLDVDVIFSTRLVAILHKNIFLHLSHTKNRGLVKNLRESLVKYLRENHLV